MNADSESKAAVLIVDDTPTNLEVLINCLSNDYEVFVATDGESAIAQLQHARPDLILLDVMMPGIDGFETCRRLKEEKSTSDIPVIFMTALADTVDKVEGFSVGAVDYITKPIQHEEVLARVNAHLTIRNLQTNLEEANDTLERRVTERTAQLSEALTEVEELKDRLEAENDYLQEEIKKEHNFEEIISSSAAFERVLQQVTQVAVTHSTVLLLGETGTGKELLARAVHSASPRRDRPLVKVNCAALPANLIESELFGHEKGAFTGALSRRIGRFELADSGTIFLDEIGDMQLELQAKLLRVLQEGEIERLGNPRPVAVDVRVIAATNRDLEEAIVQGEFRQDLFYRLNVFPITSPPLRERREDIPALVQRFVAIYGAKVGKEIARIPQGVIDTLQSYHWPGNVRELENIIERALITTSGPELQLGDWRSADRAAASTEPTAAGPSRQVRSLEEVEKEHIITALQAADGKVSGSDGAAELLGLKASTLESRMKRLGITRGSFQQS